MRHVDTWTDCFRGVGFEVKRFTTKGFGGEPDHNSWAHYIFLNEKQVPTDRLDSVFLPRDMSKKPWGWFDYYSSILASLKWHGEITFYDYECEAPGFRVVRAGCDYSHPWDSEAGYPHDLDWVVAEAKATIDSLWELVPGLLVRCSYNGKYYSISEMANETISIEAAAAQKEYRESTSQGG